MVKIQFETNTAAFEGFLEYERESILLQIIRFISGGKTEGIIHDLNGNKIGEWNI